MSISETSGFSLSLSELQETNNFLDPESFVEISRLEQQGHDDIQDKYKSYKIRLKYLSDGMVEKCNIYTNLENIFNSSEHLNETYFSSSVEFKKNPYIHVSDISGQSSKNKLVTKTDINEYLKSSGIGVPIHTASSKYVYYLNDSKMWIEDDLKTPMVLNSTKDGIWTSKSKLKFHYGHALYAFTDEVVAPKNIMLDVTGNIVLDELYQNLWYENQNYFVALTIHDKIMTLCFLKNILNITDSNKKNYVVAQFHFHCPLSKNAKFKIVTNAKCKLFGIKDKDIFSRKLYDSLNACNLSYYDSW